MMRSSQLAWLVSAGLHVIVFALAADGISSPERLRIAEPQPVTVEIVSASAQTQVKAGDIKAKPKPRLRPVMQAKAKPKAKPKTKPVRKAAAPPKPVKTAAARPKPLPKPVRTKQAASRTSKPPQHKRKKRYTERLPRAPSEKPAKRQRDRDQIARMLEQEPPKPSRFDAGRTAALLNKDPSAAEYARRLPKAPPRQPATLEEQARGFTHGQSERMTASEIDAFRAQVSQCWTPPIGGLNSDVASVRLRLAFNRDGTLARPPVVMDSASSPLFRAAADSAVRAVLRCQPYRLPEQKFATWRDMILNFDPRHMLGG